jgi:PAS domain S-box-containing protein
LNRRLFRVFPVLAALVALLVSLGLISEVQQDTSGMNRTYLWVLVLTVLALAMLALAIVVRSYNLFKQVRNEAPGAMLSARWVRNFLMLSLPPALIVYAFSGYFLTNTIDSWFDVEVEAALVDSLALGQEFLDARTLEVRNQMTRLGQQVDANDDPDGIRRFLLANISASGPVDLTYMDRSGHVVASASYNPLASLPELPGDYALLQALERGEYAAAEPAGDGGLIIRVIQRIASTGPGQPVHVLQAIYPLPANITALTSSIEQEYFRYRNVRYLSASLKQSFLLILSLVLLMTVLVAILAALTAARRMVAPISRLSEATGRVAAGDLDQAVETGSRDELGFLAESFNDMTQALLDASNEAERSRASLQAQGEYLETVLGSLSAGVLTLDAEGVLVRMNRAATQILHLDEDQATGHRLGELPGNFDWLAPLSEAIQRQLDRDRLEWQREIRIERTGAPLVLLVRGSRLPATAGDSGGHVVVFDDVTVLNQAQRDAAWAEVARRLAHEVKNPLTPIRLAAERLRMKLMDHLNTRDAEMLDKSTTTIVAQVEALRKLVDAFGDYAREPEFERAPLQIDQLIREVVELYRQADPNMKFELELCPGPAGLSADGGRIRQLLHNLIRNSGEAAQAGHAEILIRTQLVDRAGTPWLELEVLDQGPGFPDAVLDNPFEPYVTNKSQGSGLGLAICRKIVADHDGLIKISNRSEGGARAAVQLPLATGHELSGPREMAG